MIRWKLLRQVFGSQRGLCFIEQTPGLAFKTMPTKFWLLSTWSESFEKFASKFCSWRMVSWWLQLQFLLNWPFQNVEALFFGPSWPLFILKCVDGYFNLSLNHDHQSHWYEEDIDGFAYDLQHFLFLCSVCLFLRLCFEPKIIISNRRSFLEYFNILARKLTNYRCR